MGNKLITGIMGAFVIVLLVGAALVPFINDIADQESITVIYNPAGNIADDNVSIDDAKQVETYKHNSGRNVYWVVTKDGKLFGYGYNASGQQGDGTTTNVTEFTQRLENETIASVSCSADTTWAVTTDGKLFGCGSNSYGQQGDGTTTNVTEFTQRLSDQTIASVSCSVDTTWAVTTNGKLFGCGNNTYGQQGDGTTTNVTEFTQRLSDQTIASVSCSESTTLYIAQITEKESPISVDILWLVPFVIFAVLVICIAVKITSKFDE